MGQLVVLTQQGDETIEWDPADPTATETARLEFDRLKTEGYEFFEAAETKGTRITAWDPSLKRVIAAPGVQTKGDREGGARPKAMAGGPNANLAASWS